MQTDPVFTDMPGRDSYDPYQYVGNDPINFTDPDGRKMCTGQVVAAGAIIGGAVAFGPMGAAGGVVAAAMIGVAGNWTGGGGDCSNRMPDEIGALGLVLHSTTDLNLKDPAVLFGYIHFYENYIEGNGPSFLGKMNRTELQFSMLYFHNFLQNDGDAGNNSFALFAYLRMTQDVANPRFDIDEASYYHDQYGPNVLNPKNRTATTKWMKHANRVAFSHDSWSRIYAREKKATPKWWGDARGGVATINTAATVVGNAAMAITGTALFSTANALSSMKTWKL